MGPGTEREDEIGTWLPEAATYILTPLVLTEQTLLYFQFFREGHMLLAAACVWKR